MSEIKPLSLESKDLVSERIEQIKALFPEIATEGDGSIDFEKLRLILGDEVDESDEHYAFTWPGKSDAIRQAQTPSTATLRPCPEESVNWDSTENLYIEGDNLEVLKLLQNGYHGRVKLIYIDPPYNTGSDFVYKDTFADSIENYKEQSGISSQSNADTSGRYHSNWCSMMYPRLKLARELLGIDGAIVISIDDNEVCNMRNICNEVFGESNFVACVTWQKIHSIKNDARYFSENHEYALIYARSIEHLRVGVLPRTEEMNARYKNPDNDPRGPWQSGDLVASGERTNGHFAVVNPLTGASFDVPQGKHWVYSQENLAKLVADNQIWFGSDGTAFPRKKRFLSEVKDGRTPSTLWLAEEVGHNQSAAREVKALFDGQKLFDFPKPVAYVEQFVRLLTDDDSVVVDFFSGSATTAHSVMQLNYECDTNRKFVLVQLPEPLALDDELGALSYTTICEVGKDRIRRAGKAILAEALSMNQQLRIGEDPKKVPDIGFRVLKLDKSGFIEPEQMTLLDEIIREDRSDQDLIFELMLKWGLELTLPIEKIECAGYPCYSVAADELICCMAEGLTIEALEAIAELEPRRVLMRDKYINDTIKLNAELIFERVKERTQIEVDLRTV